MKLTPVCGHSGAQLRRFVGAGNRRGTHPIRFPIRARFIRSGSHRAPVERHSLRIRASVFKKNFAEWILGFALLRLHTANESVKAKGLTNQRKAPQPMLEMSVYETKARLSELLGLVELGMEVTITRNRIPVARLVPMAPQDQHPVTAEGKP